MKFKRVISICLVLAMLLSLTAFADKPEYVTDYDTETPVIIVHGMSQNNTYMLDENGKWATDENGGYITGWPLEINIGGLLMKALPALLLALLTGYDAGLKSAILEGAKEALSVIEKDTKGNYVNDIEVPCYECPMSELPAEVKAEYYGFLPIQELGEMVGEENVYYFGYDSLGDVMHETEKLHHYIHDVVLPKSPNGQVKLCHISLGGTIAVNYLETYPEDYELIKKMVFVIPAIDGSNVVGDLYTNNLSVYDGVTLYSDLMVTLMGETPLAYLLNIVLRLLPEDVLKTTLEGVAQGVVEVAARPSTMLWALCPDAYYEQARAMWLEDDAYASIREDADYFMNARANFKDNLFALKETGCEVFDIACYDVHLFPLCKDFRTTNADRVIHAASPAMGATFADLGKTLGDNYVAAGTYCSNPEHNHLSPDGVVDATTGLLPCTTWYFKGQPHEMSPDNDVLLKLAIRVMVDDNMKDVYSNPAYPQFNTGRLSKNARNNIYAWQIADKSGVSDLKKQEIEKAVAEVKALLDETIVDIDAWNAADAKLEALLVEAGIIEDEAPSAIDKALTALLKGISEKLNKLYA